MSTPLSLVGLIPAHAGSTKDAAAGDNEAGGSSPLTRGAHTSMSTPLSLVGLIPAHAGSTPR